MDLSTFCQSNLLYTQESLSRYQPGGYHPVTLGDSFKDDRYKIHHKLGWGGFSTVWLAKDRDRNQWVSLKIMTANSSVSRELQMLKYLEEHSQGELSSNYVVQLLDTFTHEGPNGVHRCLVFELLGPSVDQVLSDYHEGRDKIDSETVLQMSTQLLKAVRFIHSVGMCHGGNGLPTQLVKAAEWDEWIDEKNQDIRLFGFGESFFQGQEPEKLAQPGFLMVPETIFTDSFDYRVDLWRTGCTIYSFLFTTWPFYYLGEDEVLVFQMIDFVEKLPTEWESKWTSTSIMELDEDYGASKLEQKFAGSVSDPTLSPLLHVIKGLMRFLPSSRLTAENALDLLGNAQE
ncbi:hypothetical protein N7528_004137 [Penicillium herquei]|nr:hypothetical protein N7528_004137 [Penicillium herquei]